MVRRKKLGIFFTAAGIFTASFMITAFARSSVGDISLGFSSDIQAGESGGNVSVWQADNKSSYYISDYEVTNEDDDDNWSIGDIPVVEVELQAADGYYFDNKSKSAFSLSGAGAKYKSATRSSDNTTMVVSVKLDKLGGDGSVSGISWDKSSGEAMWEELNWAEEYQVKLYRGGSTVGSTVTTSDNSYDFSDRITKRGYYSFEVRGVDDDGDKGDWEESEEWYVSSSKAEDISGYDSDDDDDSPGSSSGGPGGSSTTYHNSRGPGASGSSASSGWQLDSVGWWYRNDNGSYAVNNWQLINNVWYFFDGSGYMKTGWIQWKDKWYYCNSSGAMLENTRTPDGYWVGSDGAWVS